MYQELQSCVYKSFLKESVWIAHFISYFYIFIKNKSTVTLSTNKWYTKYLLLSFYSIFRVVPVVVNSRAPSVDFTCAYKSVKFDVMTLTELSIQYNPDSS